MSVTEFNPGVNPSFVVPIRGDWPHLTWSPAKPHDTVIPLGVRPIREVELKWKGLTKDQRDFFHSFFHGILGPSGVFGWRTTDTIWSPLDSGPTLDETSGGSLSQRTYYVTYTWYDSTTTQETKPAPSSSNTIQANYLVEVEVPHMPAGVSEWRVYAHETSGSECLQATVSGTRTWTEPTTGLLTATAQPPATNNLKPLLKWRLIGGIQETKFQANRWQIEMTWREVWV